MEADVKTIPKPTRSADQREVLELEEEVGQREELLSDHFLFELVGQMFSLLELLPLFGRRLLVARAQNDEEMRRENCQRKIAIERKKDR